MKITGIVITFSSKRDVNGNRYHAFRFVDCETGRMLNCIQENENDVLQALNEWRGPTSYFWTQQELPKRLFMAKVKGWPGRINVKEITDSLKRLVSNNPL